MFLTSLTSSQALSTSPSRIRNSILPPSTLNRSMPPLNRPRNPPQNPPASGRRANVVYAWRLNSPPMSLQRPVFLVSSPRPLVCAMSLTTPPSDGFSGRANARARLDTFTKGVCSNGAMRASRSPRGTIGNVPRVVSSIACSGWPGRAGSAIPLPR